MFVSLAELAAHLGTHVETLLSGRYLDESDGRAYVLRPLDEAAYQRWHATVYARAQRQKEAA